MNGFVPTDFRKSMAFGRTETAPGFFEGAMGQMERRFNDFCKNAHGNTATITPIVHFIWLGGSLPEKFIPFIDSWKRFHPIKLWTDKEVGGLEWSHPWAKMMFDEAQILAEKSDILRYEILFQEGGIYSDIDVICFKSFHDLIANGLTFFAGQETNRIENENGQTFYLCNALFGATKGHPILHFCLEHVVSQAMAPTEPIFSRTGQTLLTRAVEYHLSDESVLVLPCSYFYPLPFFEDLSHKALTPQVIEEKYIAPESMALHMWAATWYS